MRINYRERVEAVTRNGDGFHVRTAAGTYQARAVLLGIGRRGTPRKLGVSGEDRDKVSYRLIDPEQYVGRKVLVVGGGDSALEAAVAIAEQRGTTVTLSYRASAFGRAKEANRRRVEEAQAAGRLHVLLESNVFSIGTDDARIEHAGRQLRLANDAVIVCAGGILPTPFLKQIGIRVETKRGTS